MFHLKDEWDRVVALQRHKFVTGATLLQLCLWMLVDWSQSSWIGAKLKTIKLVFAASLLGTQLYGVRAKTC